MMPLLCVELEIDGICPQRALDKLVKKDIRLFRVQKMSPSRLKLRVKSKDLQKVFAILRGSCYTVTKRFIGLSRALACVRSAPGILVGAALALAVFLGSQQMVLRIELSGAFPQYGPLVRECLADAGVRAFGFFDRAAAERAESELLALPGVQFAKLEKSGSVLTVTLEGETESEVSPRVRHLYAPCAGTVESLVVLRGTARAEEGEQVQAGQLLVEGVLGEQTQTYACARCTLLCEVRFEWFGGEGEEQTMLARAKFLAGGETVRESVQAKEEANGVRYTVSLTVRRLLSVGLQTE